MTNSISNNHLLGTIQSLNNKLKWSSELNKKLIEDSNKIQSEPKLIVLIDEFKNNFKDKNLNIISKLKDINLTDQSLRDTAPIFMALSAIPIMLTDYETKKIPLSFAYEVLNDLQLWINDFKRIHNRFGLAQLGWITNHLRLSTFQIKQFQYEKKTYTSPFRLYTNISTNKLLCVAEAGLHCDDKGLIISDAEKEKINFTTKAIESSKEFSVNTVSPNGYIQKECATFQKNEWNLITKPGDNQLTFHIPEGSKLSLENLNTSFNAAKDFFKNHYPEFEYNIFETNSWVFDDQISHYLPESNISKFQKCIQLLPIKNGNDEQFKERVFGSPNADVINFEPKTTLQKIGKEHILNGNQWRKKAFVLFKNHLPLQQNNLHFLR